MRLPYKTLERKLFKSGYQYIFGVDEVGMGCLAGPVVVCAVAMTNHFYNKHHKGLRWLRESKLLLPHQREKFSGELLKEKDFAYAISSVSPKTIDKINIYQAARLGMKRAIKTLARSCHSSPHEYSDYLRAHGVPSRATPSSNIIILVDGPHKIRDVNFEQMPIVKGDRKVFAIACASIIAKVHRDKMMVRYAKKYPGYGFERHKGYSTKHHQTRLAFLGPCKIHRKSFAPVRNCVEKSV